MGIDDLLDVWMRRWGPNRTKERVRIIFKDNPHAKVIVDGTVANRWSDRDVALAVIKHKDLSKIRYSLLRKERSKEVDFEKKAAYISDLFKGDGFNDRGSSGSRKPLKPLPSSGSGSAAKRLKRKKQFDNEDEFYFAKFWQRP